MRKLILSLFLVAVFIGAVASRPASLVAAPLLQAGTLVNPSFEDPYSNGAAQGWGRWHEDTGVPKPENCSARYAWQPTWSREANGSIVADGAISQHIGNQFDTWHAGVMQNVAVTPGVTYRFTFVSTGRASNEQYPAPSNTEVNMGVRAGIDPNGSGIWNDADIVWGGSGSPHMSGGTGNWQSFTVDATASGNQITVFASADFSGANQCRAHLDIWFDGAQLVAVDAQPTAAPTNPPPPAVTQPPPPPATQPPAATFTPESTEIAQVPPETPPPAATPTETPVPGGTICANAFADNNANGVRDEDEGVMAGVTFRAANDANELVGQGVSSGPDPVCFEELPAGAYQVAQEVPPALEMTTAGNVSLDVLEGQTILVEFGSRIRPLTSPTSAAGDGGGAATATPDSGAEEGNGGLGGLLPSGGSSNILLTAGIAVLCLAFLILGGLVFFLMRMRA